MAKRVLRGIEIPPKYKGFLYRAFNDAPDGPDEFYRIVFTFDLIHAELFMRDFVESQGLDLKFRFIAVISFADIDILQSEYNSFQLTLDVH